MKPNLGKILALVIVLIIIGLLTVFLFRFGGKENITPAVSAIPTTSVTAQKEVIESVTEEFSKKYQKPKEVFLVTVDTDLGNYAKGSVRDEEEMGGGLWFAAKVDGAWQLVFDGNGIITCKVLNEYPSFPPSLIPQCYDESKNILIKR